MANNEQEQLEMDKIYEDAQEQSDYYGKAKDVARKAKRAKKAAEVASKQATNATVKAIARGITFILPYIGTLLLGIVIFIVLISIIVFFLSGPDILMGQITTMTDELIANIKMKVSAPFVGSDYAAVTSQHIADTAAYIENMGYNLESNGFITASEAKTIERNGNNRITKIESEIIQDYIAAENRTYMPSEFSVSSLWLGLKAWVNGKSVDSASRGMIELVKEIDAVDEIVINGRTIKYDTLATGENDNGSSGSELKSLESDVEIDRTAKKMIITIDEERIIKKENNKTETKKTETKIVYNLQGWVGRYGKPIEFLLALHLGTMAPRFAQTVATSPEFETKVNMRIFKSVEVTRLTFNGMTLDETKEWLQKQVDEWWKYYQQVNAQNQAWYTAAVRVNPNTARPKMYTYEDAKQSAQNQLGITFEDIERGKAYEDEHTEQHYTPYIVSVENHWYKDWKFKDLDKASSDDAYVVTTPTPKESSVTFGGASFTATTYSSGEIYQIAEPKPKQNGPNKAFDDLFTNEEWYKMDGKILLPEDDSGLQKSKINPEDLNMQAVMVMLEKAEQKSDDAKFIVRDLKEYLELKGFKFKDSLILTPGGKEVDTSNKNSTTTGSSSSGSTTGGSSYNSLNNLLGGKTANVVYSGNDVEVRTSEVQTGTSVKSIVAGTVEKISDNAVQIKVSTPSSLKGKTMIISGVNMDTAIKAGDQVSKNTPIATTNGSDMIIKLQDENKNSISVKDNLSL